MTKLFTGLSHTARGSHQLAVGIQTASATGFHNQSQHKSKGLTMREKS